MNRIPVPYTVTAEHLAKGEKLVVTKNIIKSRKYLTFTADIDSLGDGQLIIGHGYMASNATWIELSKDQILAHTYFSYANPPMSDLIKENSEHGLKIEKFITVSIEYKPCESIATIVIMSVGGMFKIDVKGWYGADGEVFAMFTEADAKNCKLNWSCPDFAANVWLVGDSYSGFGHAARWPYYLRRDGYLTQLSMGYPGMNSQRGITEFKAIIDKGQPEFVMWTLGMNNGDKEGKINADYLAATEEFLAICKERGITPILSTIPNTPKVDNRYKNEWVRNSGYRYIDFCRAVGADESVDWYPEMLSTDAIHPAASGAAALYAQALADFPEIMYK